MLGLLVPDGRTLSDDGPHDFGDGTGQVGDGPLEDGSRLCGDGGNDVVDELELFLHLDHLFLLLKVLAKSTAHFEHGLADLVHDLCVIGQRFLCFGGELNVGAGKMDQNGRGPLRHTPPSCLVKPVLPPIHRFDGLGQQATALLIHQRYTVGKSQHLHGFVSRHTVAENQADFNLVGVTLGHGGGTGHGGDKARVDGFREPLLDEQFFNR